MSDYISTLMWFIAWALPSFFIQLILSFRLKNRFIKLLPLFVSAAGYIYTLDAWFNFSGTHRGWHELDAFITGVYTSIYTAGIVVAWIIYYIIKKKKR